MLLMIKLKYFSDYGLRLRRIPVHVAATVLAALLFMGCGDDVPFQNEAPDQTEIETETPLQTEAHARYVFLLIGDGMGPQQIRLAELYHKSVIDEDTPGDMLFSLFPVQTTVTTFSENSEITDSAAAATAIASGHKTGNEIVGEDIDLKKDFEPITAKAKKEGYKVGILTSASIDHATPAGFYAHQDDRNDYYEIAMQLGKTGFDFFGGGGFRKPIGEEDDLPDAYDITADAGYRVTRDKDELTQALSNAAKILAVHPVLLDKGDIPWAMEPAYELLPLSEFTHSAISFLDNPDGFFMMVEGGKIDWACHDNDAASVIHEVLAFNDTVKEAIAFYEQHPDETLIVVTADHETGGLGLGNTVKGKKLRAWRFEHQTLPLDPLKDTLDEAVKNGDSFEELMDLINRLTGLGNDDYDLSLSDDELAVFENAYLYKIASDDERDDMEKPPTTNFARIAIDLLTEKAGVGWTTDNHTAAKVPLFALGVGQERFDAPMDNTDIPTFIEQAMGIN